MRILLKQLAHALAFVAALPLLAAYGVAIMVMGRPRAFPGYSQAVSLLPGVVGVYLRRAFYRMVLAHCEQDACVSFGTVISHPTARIGRGVYVGAFCCLGDVTLEDDVLLGSHVSVANGGRQHGIDRLDVPIREQPGEWPRVTIGEDSWIGDRAVILADVGRHCVVGAGSVVVKPLPDFAVAVGNPARILRYRNQDSSAESS